MIHENILKVRVENHDFLRGNEQIDFHGRLTFALRCFYSSDRFLSLNHARCFRWIAFHEQLRRAKVSATEENAFDEYRRVFWISNGTS